jgi:hypothetical protein
MPRIKRKRLVWRDREHLATPANITRYEFACCQDCIYKKQAFQVKPKWQKDSPGKWIVKDGKTLN